jgi:hypothetical protein
MTPRRGNGPCLIHFTEPIVNLRTMKRAISSSAGTVAITAANALENYLPLTTLVAQRGGEGEEGQAVSSGPA